MSKKRLIKMGLLGVAIVSTCMLNAQSSDNANVNLVKNGDFEENNKNWVGTGYPDFKTVSKGKMALKVHTAAANKFIYKTQDITKALKPSTTYIFSVDIKRENADKGKVMAGVLERAEKDKKGWSSTHLCGKKGKANEWETFNMEFTTGAKISTAIVILYNINTGGAVWYDNVSLVEAK